MIVKKNIYILFYNYELIFKKKWEKIVLPILQGKIFSIYSKFYLPGINSSLALLTTTIKYTTIITHALVFLVQTHIHDFFLFNVENVEEFH